MKIDCITLKKLVIDSLSVNQLSQQAALEKLNLIGFSSIN
jgi:hypothetical protein